METDFPTPLGMPPHPAVYTPYRAGFCGSRGAAPRACGGKADIPPHPCRHQPARPRGAAPRACGGKADIPPLALPGSAGPAAPRRAAEECHTPLRPMRPPPHPCRRSAGPCARGPLGRAALRRPLPRHARVPRRNLWRFQVAGPHIPAPLHRGCPIVRPACTGCIRGRRPAGMRPAPAPAPPLVHAAAHKAAYDRLHLSSVHAQGARRLLVVGSANGREHSAHLLA